MTKRYAGDKNWLAVFPVAAVALLLTAQGLTPSGLDQPIRSLAGARSELVMAAGRSGRLYLCTALIILGLGCLAVSFVAIGTLCVNTRGSTLSNVAAVIAGLACLSGVVVNSLVNLNVAGASQAHAGQDVAAQILFTTNTTSVPTGFLIVYIAGLVVASSLMGTALWVAGSVPRWLGGILPIGLIVASVSPTGPFGVLLAVPFAVAMIMLSSRIWSGGRPTQAPGLLVGSATLISP